MDLSDDLCRSDYYDLICPKIEPGTNEITPVAFIDSVDYITSGTDSNNNLGSASHIKSFLDEMLFADNNGLTSATINGDLDGLAPHSSSSFELLGSFQWTGNGIGITGTTNGSNSDWLGTDGEVTTLTNLLDPLFVTYEQEENPGGDGVNQNKIQYFTDGGGDGGNGNSENQNSLVSSDLISTTYIRNNSTTPGGLIEQNEHVWQKQQNSPNSPFNFCDESLLRSALEAGKVIQTSNGTFGIGKSCDMTELRKVLSFPPLLSTQSHSSTSPSPTSSSTPPGSSPGTPLSNTNSNNNNNTNNNNNNNTDAITAIVSTQSSGTSMATPFYEFKVLDPMFLSTAIGDDSNIPNVEELIMTRIHLDVPTSTGSFRKSTADMSASERKINSTTTLSTKWTYATPNSHGKPVKRRKKNNNNNNNNNNTTTTTTTGQIKDSSQQHPTSILTITSCNTDSSENSISNSNSDNSRSPNSNLNGTTRKERCLHYCNLCNKGFKDKYSVNVHVRTHTGEKPFGCTLCGKNFRQKAHLAKHYQTHAAKANGHTGKGNGKR